MSERGFASELARALSRPDTEELRRAVSVYEDWSARNREGWTDDWPDELDLWFYDVTENWDRSLALIVLAMSQSDDSLFLATIAAGILEDMLTEWPRPTDAQLNRILDEARKTPRFLWMLSGVWRMSMDGDQANEVARVVGQADCNRDPLPPKPWA